MMWMRGMSLQRYGLVLAGLFIMMLVLVVPVSADIHTINWPGSGATTIITDTINSAGVTNGDVIVLNPGTYKEYNIDILKNITIRANTSYGGTAANTIIDAQKRRVRLYCPAVPCSYPHNTSL